MAICKQSTTFRHLHSISGDFLKDIIKILGDDVIYVSGTDCHGTPITERALKEGIKPEEIADKYHKEFKEVFEK